MPLTSTGPLTQQQAMEEQARKRRRLNANAPLGAPVDSTTVGGAQATTKVPTRFPSPAEMMQQRLAAQGSTFKPSSMDQAAGGRTGPGFTEPVAPVTPTDPLAAQKAGLATSVPDQAVGGRTGPGFTEPPKPAPAPVDQAVGGRTGPGFTAPPKPVVGVSGMPGQPAAKPPVTLPFLPDATAAQKAGLEASKPVDPLAAQKAGLEASAAQAEQPPGVSGFPGQPEAQPGVSGMPGQPAAKPPEPSEPGVSGFPGQPQTDEQILQKAFDEGGLEGFQKKADELAAQKEQGPLTDEQQFQQAFDEGGFDAAFKKADEIAARRNEVTLQKAFDEGGFEEFFKKADELSGGLPPDLPRTEDGNLSLDDATTQLQEAFNEGGFDKFFETADKLVASTASTAGSAPTLVETAGTPEEAVTAAVPAVDQPDPSTVAQHLAAGMDFNADTYAQSRRDAFQKQVDEGAMRLARRFALEIDPNSGEAQKFFENYYAQVAASRNELEASIQTEVASIQQGNLAAVTDLIGTEGQLEVSRAQLAQRATEMFGGEGTATLASLGVPSKPAQYETADAFAQGDPKGFKTWINRIETSFYKQNGRMPTDGELESLANGQAVVGKPTLQYQQMVQDNAEFLATQQLQREEATGLIQFAGLDAPVASLDRERLNETSRQFNETEARMAQEWADKYGLDEAQVEEMLKNSAWQREETARMNSFTIAQQMGELTGIVGFGTEDVTAGTFGIQTDSIPEATLDFDQALAQTPQFATLKKSAHSLLGRDISDKEALSLLRGESIKMQGVPTLQARQLAAEVTRSNMQLTIDIERIAAENNLKADEFEYAMEQDARAWNQQTGRVSEEFGIPTDRFRTWKFGLDKQLLRAGSEEERQGLLAESIEGFLEKNPDLEVNAGDLIAANDMFDRLYGNDQMNIARQRGMEDQQWQAAKEQMDLQQEQQEAVWAGALGLADKYKVTTRITPSVNLPNSKESLTRIFDLSQQQEGTVAERANKIITDPNFQSDLQIIKQDLTKKYGYVNDDQLQQFMVNFINNQGNQDVYVPLNYLPPNWLDDIKGTEQELLIAIVNRSAYSPERQGNGWMEAGMSLGQIAATLIAGA